MYKKGAYIIGVLILLVLVILSGNYGSGTIEVKKGYTTPLIPSDWDAYVLKNREETSFTVNGKEVFSNGKAPFVTTQNELMIPEDMVKKYFNTMIVGNKENVYLCHGENKAVIHQKKDQMILNGNQINVAGQLLSIEKTFYISGKLLSKIAEYAYTYDEKEGTYAFQENSNGKSIYPLQFSYEDIERIPDRLNQGRSGTCWAYAALSALESTCLPKEKYTFSRGDLVTFFQKDLNTQGGGDKRMALQYLLSWNGPKEGDQKVLKHVQGGKIIENPDLNRIKKALMFEGAVVTSMYFYDVDSIGSVQADPYYNPYTHAYYCDQTVIPNHEVTIVGWDDTYSRDNFVQPELITGDGAYLCLNSWGKQFGKNGLFYVSYYDSSFAPDMMVYTDIEETDNYTCIYQTDVKGDFGNAGYTENTAYFTNVYTAKETGFIDSVGFYTNGQDATYEIYGISKVEYDENGNPLLGNAYRKTLGIGHREETGFETVKLRESLPVKIGDSFGVIVKLTIPNSTHPISVMQNAEQEENSEGKGWISYDGEIFEPVEANCAVCLKAYGNREKETEK